MSHASATTSAFVTPRSARLTRAARTRPLLVVETFDHSAGSSSLLAYGPEATATATAQFTFCVQQAPADTARFTFCVQQVPTDIAQFTFCVQGVPADALGAEIAAPGAVGRDAVAEAWT